MAKDSFYRVLAAVAAAVLAASLLVLVAASDAASAQSSPRIVPTEWNANFGSLPNQICPPYTLFDDAEPENPILSGGKLTLSTSGNAEDMGYKQTAPYIDFSAPAFIEARMRFVSGSSSASARAPAAILFTTAPNIGNSLYIGQDEIFLLASNSTRGATVAVDTDDAFHTYRIEVETNGSITVFYDGDAAPILTGSTFDSNSNNGSEPRVFWGDSSSLATGVSEWEFFRHNANRGTAPACNVVANDDPTTAGDPNYTTNQNTPLTVSAANGVLINDDPLAVKDADPATSGTQPVSGPSNGTLTLNPDGSFTYTPNADFDGTDSFTYKASDDTNDSNAATVTITVLPDTTPPTLDLPTDITEEATGPNGAAVNYNATVTDDVDGNVPVDCTPTSGSTFPLGTTQVDCSATDAAGNEATGSFNVTVRDTTPPEISGVPTDITKTATSSSGAVVTYDSPTATDLVDGVVNVSCSPASGSTFALGETTVSCSASDTHDNTATQTFKVMVLYDFSGFFSPVDNLPTLNSVKAGAAIPVKFGLGGDQGLDIFAEGYPKSQQITCDSTAPVDGIEETVTASASGLTYDASTGQYNYVWKTSKGWAGSCRQLVMKLEDGTFHRANFKFK